MSLVIGIDTGGTYTDGVIIERAEKTILCKAKALTTREDLTIGIRNCIDKLEFDRFEEISVVSLSTTLATNSIVEGRGCNVGLIMIGYELNQKTPAREIFNIEGGHDVKGSEAKPLDLAAAKEAVLSMKGKVEAIAISGFFSVRNPKHELAVQEIVNELLDIPVVCAHQLSRSLGVYERSLTAVLNARLIPVIRELIVSVKTIMAEKNITGSLMIVKGDGLLMSEEQAKNKPVETILSGPASSVMGAIFLAGEKDALALDMGGTTTDIAALKNGVPKIAAKGARVGGWPTMVEAAEIYTYGLGGDSWIRLDRDGALTVGPQRVWPVSVVAGQYTYYADELRNCSIFKDQKLLYSQAVDGFMRLKKVNEGELSDTEKMVWDMLKNGPRTLSSLAAELNLRPNFINMNRLVGAGMLARISLTPTDILIAAGGYELPDSDAAKVAVDILARRAELPRDEFIKKAINLIAGELCYTVLQSISEYEGNTFILKESAAARYFINKLLAADASDFADFVDSTDSSKSADATSMLNCSLSPSVPIIGIGAPVRAWLPKMNEKLRTRLIIPPDYEVAGAVGSATGKIMETVKILIRAKARGSGYLLYSEWEMKEFGTLNEATDYGLEAARAKANEMAVNAGAKDFSLISEHKHFYVRSDPAADDKEHEHDDEHEHEHDYEHAHAHAHQYGGIYLETKIKATAVERPEWERRQ